MDFAKTLTKFRRDDSGAVTVDWVVLTAAIVGLGVLVVSQISSSLGSVTRTMSDDIADTRGTASTAFGTTTP